MSVPSRITHNMMSQHLLTDVRRSNAEIARSQNEVSSGKRIQSAADDPTGAHRALRLRSALEQNDAIQAGIDAATGWTSTTESALKSVTDVIHRARELMIQASNDTYNAEDRKQVAGELGQLLEQIKSDANAKFGDQYVFSGTDATVKPYTQGGADTYLGNGDAVNRSIGPGVNVRVNVTGGDLFGGTPGDGKLIDTMRSAIAALNGGTAADINNLRGPILGNLVTNLDTVVTARSTIGAVQNRATLADSRLEDAKVAVTSQLVATEDVDMAEALIRLSSQQTAYQAALTSGAKVIQPSLMDFLR